MNQLLETGLTNELEENVTQNTIETKQNNFLGKAIGKAINTAIDTGLRILLPNSIEDGVIDVKNALFREGLKEGIKTAVSSTINLGKSAIGIITGKFENISQAYSAVKSGGLIDATSKALDSAIKSANKNGLIKDGTAKLIKKGKNVVKESISSNIEKTFMEQVDSIEKIGKYINNWNKYLQTKDEKGMEREYKKIQDKLENVLPLEETLNEVESISNIQTLIKNKGGIENLSAEEIELAKKLV